ncbi:MAG TPA: hypothetical protein VNN79_01680 [Actinomycetota bacterium]|nr:hypothetical protein [Actinomycetota bacterium]
MERQAIKTDLAIASVGKTLDGVGSKKNLKSLEAASKDLRTLGTEAENVDRRSRRMSNTMRTTERDVTRMGRAFRGAGDAFKSLAILMKPAMFLGIGTAIGVLVQAVGALSGGIISLLPRMTDWVGLLAPATAGITGLGLALVTTKLAFNGLSQALGGNKKAMAQLTPEGRKLLATLRQMRPIVKELRQSSQQGLFPGIETALRRLQRGVPTLQRLLRAQGQREGRLAVQAATQFTTPGALSDFEKIGTQGGQMFSRAGGALLDFISILRNFAVAAQPFTDWLTKSIAAWVKHRKEVAEFNRDSGKTAAFLNRSKVALTNLWHIATNLWGTFKNIGRAARPLGDDLWRSAEKTTAAWERATRTNEKLTVQFMRMRPAIHEINAIIGGLVRGIFRMGSDPGLPKTLRGIRGMGSALEKIFSSLANNFGPAIASLLTSLANTLNTLTGATGPLKLMVELLDRALRIINGIASAIPGFGSALGAALDVFLISRFLTKLGLLEAGWWRVARAAGAAGAATSAATGGGFFGFGRGRGGGGSIRSTTTGNPIGFGIAGGVGGGGRSILGGGLRGGLGTLGGSALRGGMYGLLAAPIVGGLGTAALGSRGGSILGEAAGGAAFGATVGSVIPGVGTVAGGLIGGGLGALHATLSGAGTVSRADVAGKYVSGAMSDLALQHFPNDIARLTAELKVYQIAQRGLANDRSRSAREELVQINQEIAARQSVVAQLRAERQQRITGAAVKRVRGIEAGLDRAYGMLRGGGSTELGAILQINRTAYRQIEQTRNPTARARYARDLLHFEKGVLGEDDPHYRRTRGYLQQLVPGLIGQGRPGYKATGTSAAVQRLKDLMNVDSGAGNGEGIVEQLRQRRAAAPTRLQKMLIAELVAAGFPGGEAAATAKVLAADATGKPPAVAGKATAGSNWTVPLPRAMGGRTPGMGLGDSVPAMLAPGELVVNRHQEAAADSALGGQGRLGQIVGGIKKSHSAFAKGGRVPGAGKFGGADILSPKWYNRTVALGKWIQGLGYAVGENPAFGGVHPVHVPNSYHYIGQALDVNADNMPGGEMKNLDRLWGRLHKSANSLGLSQLIWRAPGHWDHLHVALGAGIGGRGSYFPAPQGLGGMGGARGVPALGGSGSSTNAGISAAGAVFGGFGGGGGGGMLGKDAVFGGAAKALGATRSLVGLPLSAYTSTAGGGGGGANSFSRKMAGVGSATSGTAVLSGEGGRFAARLAAMTGLDPRVTAAWVRAENNGGGLHNWLNVSSDGGKSYSGAPTIANVKGARFSAFPNLGAALSETAYWINSMSNFAGIKGSAGKSPAAQIAAIMASPWDQAHYSNGSLHLNKGGRVPFGGWFGDGGTVTADKPTLIGIGEKGRETATVTPHGRAGVAIPGSLTIQNLTIHSMQPGDVRAQVLAEIEAAWGDFEREMRAASAEQGGG